MIVAVYMKLRRCVLAVRRRVVLWSGHLKQLMLWIPVDTHVFAFGCVGSTNDCRSIDQVLINTIGSISIPCVGKYWQTFVNINNILTNIVSLGPKHAFLKKRHVALQNKQKRLRPPVRICSAISVTWEPQYWPNTNNYHQILTHIISSDGNKPF